MEELSWNWRDLSKNIDLFTEITKQIERLEEKLHGRWNSYLQNMKLKKVAIGVASKNTCLKNTLSIASKNTCWKKYTFNCWQKTESYFVGEVSPGNGNSWAKQYMDTTTVFQNHLRKAKYPFLKSRHFCWNSPFLWHMEMKSAFTLKA